MVSESPNIDTVVAVATPRGRGGLAVVRVSGPDAVATARAVCAPPAFADGVESHHAVLVEVRHPADGSPADRAVALPMLAPRSYTGEDVVEFFCHGGDQPARLVVEACLAAGARTAPAGEFTRRAFLNGRLSLDQAEAVADLIHAENALAARAALAQLRGGLRDELRDLERPLLAAAVELEGCLEFEDEEGVAPDLDALARTVADAEARLEALLVDAGRDRRVRNGVQVVVAGPVNAGKSSLFNALLGDDRAIVDREAGTTRDVIRERRTFGGVSFAFHDTAGLRERADRVENEGMARTQHAVAEADIVLWTVPRDGEDAPTPPETPDGGPVVIVVGTKVDLGGTPRPDEDVATSAKEGLGLDELRAALVVAAEAERMHDVAAAGRALSRRHRERLATTREELERLAGLLREGAPLEVVATQLSMGLRELGEVTGRVYSERLLTEIFQAFCVGK